MVFKRLKLSFLILLISIISSAAYAGEVAEVVFVRGKAQIFRQDKIIKLAKGFKLFEGDYVKTGTKSLVILSFLGQSKLKIDANSKLIIKKLKYKKEKAGIFSTRFFLQMGSVLIDYLNKDKKNNQLEVKTKSASFGVRGTRFLVGVDRESQDTILSVQHGKVEARSLKSHRKYLVGSGLGVILERGRFLSGPKRHSFNKNINWNIKAQRPKRILKPNHFKDFVTPEKKKIRKKIKQKSKAMPLKRKRKVLKRLLKKRNQTNLPPKPAPARPPVTNE